MEGGDVEVEEPAEEKKPEVKAAGTVEDEDDPFNEK